MTFLFLSSSRFRCVTSSALASGTCQQRLRHVLLPSRLSSHSHHTLSMDRSGRVICCSPIRTHIHPSSLICNLTKPFAFISSSPFLCPIMLSFFSPCSGGIVKANATSLYICRWFPFIILSNQSQSESLPPPDDLVGVRWVELNAQCASTAG